MFSTLFLHRDHKQDHNQASGPQPTPRPAGQEGDSLPEFYNGGAGINQVSAGHVAVAHGGVGKAGVLAVLVVEDLYAAGSVPLIVTGGPGQSRAEGLDQVVEAPGQNHDVVGVAEEHNHHGGKTKSCRAARGKS